MPDVSKSVLLKTKGGLYSNILNTSQRANSQNPSKINHTSNHCFRALSSKSKYSKRKSSPAKFGLKTKVDIEPRRKVQFSLRHSLKLPVSCFHLVCMDSERNRFRPIVRQLLVLQVLDPASAAGPEPESAPYIHKVASPEPVQPSSTPLTRSLPPLHSPSLLPPSLPSPFFLSFSASSPSPSTQTCRRSMSRSLT